VSESNSSSDIPIWLISEMFEEVSGGGDFADATLPFLSTDDVFVVAHAESRSMKVSPRRQMGLDATSPISSLRSDIDPTEGECEQRQYHFKPRRLAQSQPARDDAAARLPVGCRPGW